MKDGDTLHFEVEPEAKEDTGFSRKDQMQGNYHNVPPGAIYMAGSPIAAGPLTAPAPITSNALIERALAHPNAEQMVAVVGKLIDMRNADEDRTAKKNFEAAFAQLQKEIPAITPDKQVKRRNGDRMYDYASLPYLKSIVDPLAQKYGFSYYWSQEDSDDGKMRTVFHLCNFGHERKNWFQSAMLKPITSRDGSDVTNEVQAARGTESYQKRATFIDGFGITILGEDNDASTIELDAEIRATLEKMDKAETADKLLDLNKIAVERYRDDKPKLAVVLGCYQINRKRFTGAQ